MFKDFGKMCDHAWHLGSTTLAGADIMLTNTIKQGILATEAATAAKAAEIYDEVASRQWSKEKQLGVEALLDSIDL